MSRPGSRPVGTADTHAKLLKGGTVVSAQFLNTIRKSMDAVVLSTNDVSRIKAQTVIVSTEEALKQKAAAQAEKDKLMAESKARKLKMQLLEDVHILIFIPLYVALMLTESRYFILFSGASFQGTGTQ
jgi:ribosomal silencing factor RsfS